MSDRAIGVNRILTVGVLALLLLVCFLLLDGPVSILGWILAGALILCLVFIVTASVDLRNHLHSIDPTDHSHDL